MNVRFWRRNSWKRKQRAAAPGRYYGNGGTIHHSGYLDVETHRGTVIAVWFRCQQLPFQQSEVSAVRAADMESVTDLPALTGVEVLDGSRL